MLGAEHGSSMPDAFSTGNKYKGNKRNTEIEHPHWAVHRSKFDWRLCRRRCDSLKSQIDFDLAKLVNGMRVPIQNMSNLVADAPLEYAFE